MPNKEEMIRVILCKPGEKASITEIGDSLESMQKAVGGWIEEYMPFEDEVAIVCNEEGKINGLTLNRAITDEDGQLQDIIAGDFFIAYAPMASEKFLSMPEELEKKYLEKFEMPEMFYRDNGSIKTIKYDPDSIHTEKASVGYER
nr:DUF3846 domain-containing protein [Clostridia bacterium]